MSNIINNFYVPILKNKGCWVNLRSDAKGARDWRGYRKLSGVVGIAGHHTVTHPTGNAGNEVEVVRHIHMNGRGWGGIGYNFIISSQEKNGYAIVYQIGDIGSVRAHTPNSKSYRGWNKNSGNWYLIGISVIGMNHLVAPTDAQYRSYHELLKELIYNENSRLPNLKSWDDWQPHWKFDATACYGRKLDRSKVITPPSLIEQEDPIMIKELQAEIVVLKKEVKELQAGMKELGTDLGEQIEYGTKLQIAFGEYKKTMEEEVKVLKDELAEESLAKDKAEKERREYQTMYQNAVKNLSICKKENGKNWLQKLLEIFFPKKS